MTTTSNGHAPDRRVPPDVPPYGTPPEIDPDADVLEAGDEVMPEGQKEPRPEPAEQIPIKLPAPTLIPRRQPAGDDEQTPEGERKPQPVDAHLIERPAEPLIRKRKVAGGERPPAVPIELTDPQVLRDSIVRIAKEIRYRIVYSTTRSPKLLTTAAWWSLRGAGAVVLRLTRWGFDVDGHPLTGLVTAHDDRAYMRMAHERTRRQKFRLGLLGVAFVVALVLGVAMPAQLTALVVVGALVLLTRVGRPQGEVLLSPAVSNSQDRPLPRLTSQQVVRALSALGIATLTRQLAEDSTRIWRGTPVAKIGSGRYVVRIQLPLGVVANELIPHEQRLASALMRPADTVIVEPLPHVTPGDLKMYVLDKPVLAGRPAEWPLVNRKKVSVFEPIPLGRDRIGNPYKLPLIEQNVFTGGIPGSGKSALIRVIAAAAALDSLCTLSIINFKGTPDFMALQPVCHRYLSANPDVDREVLPSVLAVLEEVAADVGRRADLLTKAAKAGKAPDSKITDDLAKRIPGLRPYVFVIDEAHRLFEPPADEKTKKRAEELLTQIIRLGRAHGVILVMATQLGDADSMPARLLRMASVRMCMRVSDHIALNQIMGTGASRTLGVPTDFTPGTGLVRTATGTTKVRSYYLDGTALARIGQTALGHRKMLGALSGEAVGDELKREPKVDPTVLLRHVLDVIGQAAPVGDQTVAWTGGPDGLAAVLSARFPDMYGGLTDRGLNDEFRRRGVTVEQFGRRLPDDGESRLRVQTGVKVEEIRRALAIMLEDQAPSD